MSLNNRPINRKDRRIKLSFNERKMRQPANMARLMNPDRTIYAPENLILADGQPETIEFFSLVRKITSGTPSKEFVAVDLVNTRRMDLGAALALVAEFDRWQRLQFGRLVPQTTADWDPDIREELNSLGFFRLLKTNLPPALRRIKRKAFIQFVSDTATIGRAATLLRRRLEGELHKSTGYDHQIYIVLIEAMKNAFQHAYPDDKPSPGYDPIMGKRWWMAAAIDAPRQSIEVAFLDLGVTIPYSLTYSWMWQHLPPAAKFGSDIQRIVEALKYGHSRLGLPHRGKGFSNMIQPVTLNPKNHLSILSGKGFCLITPREVVGYDISESFKGTLIRWKMSLT